MKKHFRFSIPAILCSLFIVSGCKKGENDPFLSVHTRKARVAGEWKMTSGTSTQNNYYSSASTTNVITTTYDGVNASESSVTTTPFGTTTTNSTYAYTDQMTMERDGTMKGTNTNDGVTTTFEGNWNFSGGIGEMKNKSQLMLLYTKVTDDNGTSTLEANTYQIIYDINELRTKKMVLTYSQKTVYDNGDSFETTSEMTYEQ